jgi:hypothetical protein
MPERNFNKGYSSLLALDGLLDNAIPDFFLNLFYQLIPPPCVRGMSLDKGSDKRTIDLGRYVFIFNIGQREFREFVSKVTATEFFRHESVHQHHYLSLHPVIDIGEVVFNLRFETLPVLVIDNGDGIHR